MFVNLYSRWGVPRLWMGKMPHRLPSVSPSPLSEHVGWCIDRELVHCKKDVADSFTSGAVQKSLIWESCPGKGMETHSSQGLWEEKPLLTSVWECAGQGLCQPSQGQDGPVVGKGCSLGLTPTHTCFEAVDSFCWLPAILFSFSKVTHLERWYCSWLPQKLFWPHTSTRLSHSLCFIFYSELCSLTPMLCWHTQNCTLKVATLWPSQKSLLLVFLLASVPRTQALTKGTYSLLMCQTRVHGFVLLKKKSWLFMQFPMSHSTPLNYFWQMWNAFCWIPTPRNLLHDWFISECEQTHDLQCFIIMACVRLNTMTRETRPTYFWS